MFAKQERPTRPLHAVSELANTLPATRLPSQVAVQVLSGRLRAAGSLLLPAECQEASQTHPRGSSTICMVTVRLAWHAPLSRVSAETLRDTRQTTSGENVMARLDSTGL